MSDSSNERFRALFDPRGVVVAVDGPVVAVDFAGTWMPHENGGTVRHVPAGNLTKIMTNGVVYDY